MEKTYEEEKFDYREAFETQWLDARAEDGSYLFQKQKRALLNVIARYVNPATGRFHLSQDRAGWHLGCSDREARKRISELIDAGVIRQVKRGYKNKHGSAATQYEVIVLAPEPKVPEPLSFCADEKNEERRQLRKVEADAQEGTASSSGRYEGKLRKVEGDAQEPKVPTREFQGPTIREVHGNSQEVASLPSLAEARSGACAPGLSLDTDRAAISEKVSETACRDCGAEYGDNAHVLRDGRCGKCRAEQAPRDAERRKRAEDEDIERFWAELLA